MSEFNDHFYYLEKLIHHLDLIDEERSSVESIIREPVWYSKDVDSLCQRSLCDLILIYRDGSVRPVELKGTWKRRKANGQIRRGFDYSYEVLGKSMFRPGKSVIYVPESKSYLYELVNPLNRSLKKYLID